MGRLLITKPTRWPLAAIPQVSPQLVTLPVDAFACACCQKRQPPGGAIACGTDIEIDNETVGGGIQWFPVLLGPTSGSVTFDYLAGATLLAAYDGTIVVEDTSGHTVYPYAPTPTGPTWIMVANFGLFANWTLHVSCPVAP